MFRTKTTLRNLRKFLEGSVFINTLKSLIMRDSKHTNIEAYSSGQQRCHLKNEKLRRDPCLPAMCRTFRPMGTWEESGKQGETAFQPFCGWFAVSSNFYCISRQLVNSLKEQHLGENTQGMMVLSVRKTSGMVQMQVTLTGHISHSFL